MKILKALLEILLEATGFAGMSGMDNHMSMHNSFMDTVHRENFHQQMHHDMEIARMASTGIEFGGFNGDPGMNPGMMSSMLNNGMF